MKKAFSSLPIRRHAGNVWLVLFTVATMLAGVAPARGQSAPDSFDPNADGNNIVRVDGINCISSDNQEKQPAPDGGNFPNSPDSTSDIEDSDGGLDDSSPHVATRNSHDLALFSVTGRDAVTPRMSRIVPVPLFPVHCFYCLHEHIRERAPPIPV